MIASFLNIHMNFLVAKDKESQLLINNLNPKFTILDEPTSALDRSIQIQVIDVLKIAGKI